MPKYAATVQFKETRAQWTVSSVKRDDGMGWSQYGVTAPDWDAAVKQAVGLYEKGRVDAEGSEFGMLLDGEPDFIIISCEEPRGHRTFKWPVGEGFR